MKIYTFILFFSICTLVHAEIKGKGRDEFVGNFRESCFESQKNDPGNKGVNSDFLKRYCNCMSTYFADNSEVNQLLNSIATLSSTGQKNDFLQKMTVNGKNYCIKNMGKF